MRLFGTMILLIISSAIANGQTSRTWTDSSGNYQMDADLIARDDSSVVLESEDKRLVIVDINDLSDADKDYLTDLDESNDNRQYQTWEMASGIRVQGDIVEYGRRDVQIHRKRGKLYVNDTRFGNLPEVYQKMIPRIVQRLENVDVEDEKSLLKWVAQQPKASYEATLEGVMLELPNGDQYGVPFFFFSNDDRQALKPGWDEWVAAEENEQYRRDLSLRLKSRAIEQKRTQKQQEKQQAATREMMRMQLVLGAVDAGATDLWEVTMMPPRGLPIRVVVPGQNSQRAKAAAQAKYPNAQIVGVAKKSDRWRRRR